MSEIASGYVSLLPSAKGFGSKLQSQVGAETDGVGKKLGSSFGKLFALGAGVLVGGAALGFLKDAVAEGREAQKVGALTASVIKATGGAANVTAKQVGLLAGSLSLKTGIDDEVIQSGQNMLLTFKNVRNEAGKGNDIFSQSTKTLIDMSAAMGTEPKQAAIQLGKALNDPVKGISALSRVGVTFTEGQKETIKSLVAGGDTMKAQKIILKELNSEFGGAAEAQATAGEKAAVAVGNLKEQIGTALLPLIDKIELAFVAAMPAISGFIAGIGPAFSQVAAFIAPVFAQIQGFFGAGAGGGIVAGIATFAAMVQANFLPVLQTMAATFQTVILPAVTSFVTYIATALVPIFRTVAGIITGQVVPILASLATFFYGTLYPAIFQIVTAVASNLKPVFDQLVATFQSRVLPAVQNLLVKFREWQPTIQLVVLAIVKVVGKVLEFAAAILGKVLPVAIRFAGFLTGALIGAIVNVVSACIKIIQVVIRVGQQFNEGSKQIDAFVRKALAKVGAFLTFMGKLPGKIESAIGDLGDLLLDAGKALIQGLIDGVTDKLGDLKAKLGEVTDFIPEWKGPPDKDKVLLRPAGQMIMGGLVDGIDDGLTPMQKKLQEAADKARDAMIAGLRKQLGVLTDHRDKIKSVVDQIKSDMASLADSVKGAFTGGLFDVSAFAVDLANGTSVVVRSAAQMFTDTLGDKKAELTELLAAFKKLKKWGLPAAFLGQLFASGNSALILEMASGNRGMARQDAKLFGQVDSLSQQLGGAVAGNQYGPELRKQTHLLAQVEGHLRHLDKRLGHEINHAAAAGHRGRVA